MKRERRNEGCKCFIFLMEYWQKGQKGLKKSDYCSIFKQLFFCFLKNSKVQCYSTNLFGNTMHLSLFCVARKCFDFLPGNTFVSRLKLGKPHAVWVSSLNLDNPFVSVPHIACPSRHFMIRCFQINWTVDT